MFEQIEAYLAGELNAEEKTAFEQKLQSDPNLAEEVALQRDTHQLLDLYQQVSYKDKLKAIDAEMAGTEPMEAETKVIPLFQRRGFQLAAAAVMVLVVAAFLLMNRGKSPSQLADEAYTTYPNLTTLRGDEAGLDSIMNRGMAAYSTGNYAVAIEELRLAASQQTDDPETVFYLGLAQLGDKQPGAAIQHLSSVRTDPDYGQTADWYLALAYLFEDNAQEAQEVLKEIVATPSHAYKDKANTILEQL